MDLTILDDVILEVCTTKQLVEINWTVIPETDKVVYINNVEAIFSTFSWKGKPLQPDSIFPRVIRDVTVEEPKAYQRAVALGVFELIRGSLSKRAKLQAEGVTEIKVDKVTEKFFKSTDQELQLNPNKYKQYFKGYIRKTMFNK